MNRKTFKYEGKNKKNIRLRDILMLLSVFALSIITVTVTTDLSELDNKKSAEALVQSTDTKTVDIKIESEESSADTPPIEVSNVLPPSSGAELKFIKPCDGTAIKGYSSDELIYSQTMDDWRIHTGVDIACPIGSDVLASEDGVIKSLYYDINLGNCLVLECGEYRLKYCSLSSEYFVEEGQSVAKGELIAKSSDSAMSEICDEPHIHFEMTKNEETINPETYIDFN